MKSVLSVLLLTATLHAQPVVSSVEQSYGPYARPDWGGSPTLAVSRSGILLAWSEGNTAPRIHTGLLDRRGRLVTPIATLPVGGTEASESVAPASASDGTAFLLVWLERKGTTESLRGAPISTDGVPGLARTYGTTITSKLVLPYIVWNGAAYRVWTGTRTYEIARDGELLSSHAVNRLGTALAHANGVWGTARTLHQPLWLPGDLEDVYIEWTAGERQGKERIAERRPRLSATASFPSIASAGEEFAVAWSSFEGVGYLVTSGTGMSREVSASARLDEAPGIACDDQDCIVAWGTYGGDVEALVFEADRVRGPVLFTIAASERNETAPQVFSIAPGRFLVAWLSDQGADRRFVGRIVTTRAVRRRAIR